MQTIERIFQLIALSAAVTFRGLTFAAVNARTNGEEPNEAAGFVFRPLRHIAAVEATETTPAQPERWEEIPGAEFFCAAAEPDLANAGAVIEAFCQNPPVPPPAPVYRVLKDTIVLRIKEAGKLTQLRQVIAGLDEDQRFEWDTASWFSSNNTLIVQGVQAIGLDASVILARDPLAP